MRYTAFLALGVLLLIVQGELYLVLGPLSLDAFRPSLLIPLLVYLGVTETNLALGASVAFLLGYFLDVVGGSPIGLHAFTSVATVALARVAGLRIVTQGGVARALLAGIFAAFAAVVALILLAIFGRAYEPRVLIRQVIPHAIATVLIAPLVYRMAARTQALASGFLDPSRSVGSTLKSDGRVFRNKGGARTGVDSTTSTDRRSQ